MIENQFAGRRVQAPLGNVDMNRTYMRANTTTTVRHVMGTQYQTNLPMTTTLAATAMKQQILQKPVTKYLYSEPRPIAKENFDVNAAGQIGVQYAKDGQAEGNRSNHKEELARYKAHLKTILEPSQPKSQRADPPSKFETQPSYIEAQLRSPPLVRNTLVQHNVEPFQQKPSYQDNFSTKGSMMSETWSSDAPPRPKALNKSKPAPAGLPKPNAAPPTAAISLDRTRQLPPHYNSPDHREVSRFDINPAFRDISIVQPTPSQYDQFDMMSQRAPSVFGDPYDREMVSPQRSFLGSDDEMRRPQRSVQQSQVPPRREKLQRTATNSSFASDFLSVSNRKPRTYRTVIVEESDAEEEEVVVVKRRKREDTSRFDTVSDINRSVSRPRTTMARGTTSSFGASAARRGGEWTLKDATVALEERLNKVVGLDPRFIDLMKVLTQRAQRLQETTDIRFARTEFVEIQRIQSSVRDHHGSNRSVALLLSAIDRIVRAAEDKLTEIEGKGGRTTTERRTRVATRGTYIFDTDSARPPVSATSDDKKFFFGEAVRLKSILPPHSTTKNLLVTELYDECLSQGIPRGEWTAFLKKKLGL